MKFLIALSVLASTSVFANDLDHKIKCYETAQGEHRKPSLVFAEYGNKLFLTDIGRYDVKLKLEQVGDCLISRSVEATDVNHFFQVCETDGQTINGLIPVDYEINYDGKEWEETVYCEADLADWFE